jgi:AcrR family transcriptional regulator
MTPTKKLRGEYAKSAERRDQILQAGLEVFAASGSRGGSLREVAERVGISQAGLLHHFPSKNSLLTALLERRDADQVRLIGPVEGVDAMRALVELVTHNAETPGLVALYSVLAAEAIAPDHPVHDYFRNRHAWVSTTLTEAFRLAKERGEVRPEVDPRSAARTVTALVDGLQLQWLMDPSFDMAEEVRRYVQSLLTVDLAAADPRAA